LYHVLHLIINNSSNYLNQTQASIQQFIINCKAEEATKSYVFGIIGLSNTFLFMQLEKRCMNPTILLDHK